MNASDALERGPAGVDRREWLLQRRWFEAQALRPPVLPVHPDDEMARSTS
jgi:hypothetical protein